MEYNVLIFFKPLESQERKERGGKGVGFDNISAANTNADTDGVSSKRIQLNVQGTVPGQALAQRPLTTYYGLVCSKSILFLVEISTLVPRAGLLNHIKQCPLQSRISF